MLHTPYDKATKRYTEIADFFVPRGYAVVLVDMRDRYRSEGSGTYFHSATPHTGHDGYDIVEWIAEQPWSNGRVGTVGSSYAGQVQIRTALERPPHLTAIWPDVVTTNNYANCSREGGAMQRHMFWALFIHAQDAQEVLHDPALSEQVWDDLQEPARALPGDAVAAWADLASARAGARADADRLLHTRRLRRLVGADRVRLHRLLRPARRRADDGLVGLVRPVGGA